MSIAVPENAEVWQLDSDRTCYSRTPGGWIAFGSGETITDDEMVGAPMRRLLDNDGRLAPERLLGVNGLVTES